MKSEPRSGRLTEVAAVFLKLGLISFGGPIAHLGYLRAEFVTRRRWLEEADYADLVALCQFLPGPASSQAVYALGRRRAGRFGGTTASIAFTLPSALLMIAFAYGVTSAGDLAGAGWLHGLKLTAVAVVAQAVWGMGRTLCPDAPRRLMGLAAAALLVFIPGAIAQILVIAAGGVAGWWLYRREATPAPVDEPGFGNRGAGAVTLLLFATLLAGLPALVTLTHSPTLAVFDAFYRAGSLVFGGGHVVLPLLRAEVVPNGWVTDDQFLAGYGAAQAVPGPLFTLSAFLGTVMRAGSPAWLNGLWCLLAIFLPAWLLIEGALPFWNRLRSSAPARAGLKGANAAVVGVLLAALYNPVITGSVRDGLDVAVALAALAALQLWKIPPWAVVLLMAGVGSLR